MASSILIVMVAGPSNRRAWYGICATKRFLKSIDDPLLRAAAILAAVECSDQKFAVAEYYRLKKTNPDWAKFILFLESQGNGGGLDYFFHEPCLP